MEFERKIFDKMDKILERKKQIILYGVPGVGKTYLAKKFIKYLGLDYNKNKKEITVSEQNNNYETQKSENVEYVVDEQKLKEKIWTRGVIPEYKEIELPLLAVIYKYGGAVKPKEIYDEIANLFELTPEERLKTLDDGENYFNNMVRWVRNDLKKKKEIGGEERGIWDMTEKGIQRLIKEGVLKKIQYIPFDFSISNDINKNTNSQTMNNINGNNIKNNNFKKIYSKSITFHQAFAYEEFIEGLRPKNENEKIIYEIEDGIFKKMCILAIWEVLKENNENKNLNYEQIKQKVIDAIKNKELTKEDFEEAPKYYLIIDEINRGNISNILGELITLLEKDKRLGEKNEIITELPYSKEPFAVPPNLYIIGTMNTADKSIALLDTALRRRFGFLEIEPNYDLITKDNLIKIWKDKCDDKEFNNTKKDIEEMFKRLRNDEYLKKLLKTINTKITLLKDRDHRIGHSYFLNIKTVDDLRFVWYNEIIPLLMEYFYNDWESLKEILKGFVDEKKPDIKINYDLIDDDSKLYEIKEYEGEEFIKALNSVIA